MFIFTVACTYSRTFESVKKKVLHFVLLFDYHNAEGEQAGWVTLLCAGIWKALKKLFSQLLAREG